MSDIQWEELAGTLFEEAGDALFLFDPETEEVREVNPMAQRLGGFTRRELLGMKVTYLFRSDAEGGLQRLRQAFRRTGLFHSQEGFWLRTRRGGSWVPVNLTLTRLHTEPKTLGLITARDITEHREGHARLREAETELRRVLHSISDALWSAAVEAPGKITYRLISPVIEKITGRPPEYFMSGPEKWAAIVHPDDQTRMQQAHDLLHAGVVAQMEYRIVTPTGEVRWVRDSVTCRGESSGFPLRLDGVMTDITERKEAEESVRQAATRNRLLLEQMPAVLWTTDAHLKFTSGVGAGLTALTSDGLQLAPDVYGLFSDGGLDHPAVLAHLGALRGESATYDANWADHAWHSHVEPLRDSDGAVVGVIGIALDNTGQVRAQEALRVSEANSRTLIENLSQSIFLKDAELRFTLVNRPFCENLGLPESEILGKTDYDFFPNHLADKYRQDDRDVLRTGRRIETEEQCLLQGRIRTVQTVKTAVVEGGKAVGVLGVFWDVTEQRNLEAQLRQAHKMEAVGQLAGGIAHDFNNLLTGILGNLSLALADLAPTHSCHELLASAEVAALRAAELTRQMLGFSRRAPLIPRPVNLNACIDETVRLLRRTFDPRISVITRPGRDLWPVKADSGQMNQVLMNLCLNGRDALPEGGQLVLDTANVTVDPLHAARTLEGRPGEFVRLRVSDTGCGMSPEVRERIFEPFFTTKEPGKGTGLGLAMVFGIIKVHEGWIECRSEAGQGTVFDVYLPRLVSPVAEKPTAPPAPTPNGGHETILLADDETVVNRLGQTILERQGYRVFNAADGVEALDIYRARPSEIDLVILDLAMPRLSGSETLRELRKVNPDVQVLISSGYSSDEDLRTVEKEGVVGFVAKPYRPAELARQVRQALDRCRVVPE